MLCFSFATRSLPPSLVRRKALLAIGIVLLRSFSFVLGFFFLGFGVCGFFWGCGCWVLWFCVFVCSGGFWLVFFLFVFFVSWLCGCLVALFWGGLGFVWCFFLCWRLGCFFFLGCFLWAFVCGFWGFFLWFGFFLFFCFRGGGWVFFFGVFSSGTPRSPTVPPYFFYLFLQGVWRRFVRFLFTIFNVLFFFLFGSRDAHSLHTLFCPLFPFLLPFLIVLYFQPLLLSLDLLRSSKFTLSFFLFFFSLLIHFFLFFSSSLSSNVPLPMSPRGSTIVRPALFLDPSLQRGAFENSLFRRFSSYDTSELPPCACLVGRLFST